MVIEIAGIDEINLIQPQLDTIPGIEFRMLPRGVHPQGDFVHYFGDDHLPEMIELAERTPVIWTPLFSPLTEVGYAVDDILDIPITHFNDFVDTRNKHAAAALQRVRGLMCTSFYEIGLIEATLGIPWEIPGTPITFPVQISNKKPEPYIGVWNTWDIAEGTDLLFRPNGVFERCQFEEVGILLISLPKPEEDYSNYLETLIKNVRVPVEIYPAKTVNEGMEQLLRCAIWIDSSYYITNPFKHLSMFVSGRKVLGSPKGCLIELIGLSGLTIICPTKLEQTAMILAESWNSFEWVHTSTDRVDRKRHLRLVLNEWKEVYQQFQELYDGNSDEEKTPVPSS